MHPRQFYFYKCEKQQYTTGAKISVFIDVNATARLENGLITCTGTRVTVDSAKQPGIFT